MLVPAFFGSLFAGIVIGRVLGVSAEVSRQQITGVMMFASMLLWWLVLAAPRPYSLRETMGQPLQLAGCGQALLASLGLYCLAFIGMLAVDGRDLWRAASSGGTFTINLVGPDPASPVALLTALVLAPLVEELVFRRTLFRAWRARWNPVLALLASSVLFAALHPLKVHSFLAAVTFALVYTRTRSLWSNVLAHSLTNASLHIVGGLYYFWDSPRLVLNGPVAYGALALVLLSGAGAWLHFVVKSWRTLGAPLSPDSVPATSASPEAAPEALRVGGQLS